VAIPLIREKHQPKLAHDGIEGTFRERQDCGVHGLELHLLTGPELGARHLEHRRVKIGSRDVRPGG
jgi:hypothetical protein